MDRAQAFVILNKYVKNKNLIAHMLSVEASMRFYAQEMNQDLELWGLTGLLHDFDWEIHPSMESHPSKGAPILRDLGVSEEVIRAIQSHSNHTGIPRNTLMEKALFACDEITGLITAVALIRPSRSLYDLTFSSVKKKWNDHAFAAGANREEITKAVNEFGVDLWEHVTNVIQAMQSIASQIGLAGNIQPVNL